MVKFGSLCSGIEGAAVALPHWEHAYCSEIEPFCCELLARHYPNAPNYGDITVHRSRPQVDCIIAGTPCQSFSINGDRAGMDDVRGQLAVAFSRILRYDRPRSFIWENVPGVLSSNEGRDFGAFLYAVGQLGYGAAYRVLDARYFGVAQRRRRVYVVGVHCGDWPRAASVLFDTPSGVVDARSPAKGRKAGPKVLGWTGDTTPKFGDEVVPTLRASQGGEGVGILWRGGGRKLTINEWETVMGFPVNYTEGGSDSQRRHALGNSFCPPVVRWIGERLEHALSN